MSTGAVRLINVLAVLKQSLIIRSASLDNGYEEVKK